MATQHTLTNENHSPTEVQQVNMLTNKIKSLLQLKCDKLQLNMLTNANLACEHPDSFSSTQHTHLMYAE